MGKTTIEDDALIESLLIQVGSIKEGSKYYLSAGPEHDKECNYNDKRKKDIDIIKHMLWDDASEVGRGRA